MSCFIQTYSGKRFDILNPQPEQIEIVDIAHALSIIPRFTGHTRAPYTVGQHSIMVSCFCDQANALAGLLHDAAEAYIGDLSTPLKRALDGTDGLFFIKAIEKPIMQAIAARFFLPWPFNPGVKAVDLSMCETERQDLMIPTPNVSAADFWGGHAENVPARIAADPLVIWERDVVFNTFIERFSFLYQHNMAVIAQEKINDVKSGAVWH